MKHIIRKYITGIVVFLACSSLSCCKKESMLDLFKSTGKIVKEQREAGYFDKIQLEDNINLIITQDTINKIVVQAGKNLLKLIKTDVKDNCLNIHNDNKCNWVRSFDKEINVYVSLKNLQNIYYSGSGKISTTNTIVTDYLEVNIKSGSNVVDLSIDANVSWFNIHTGPGDIKICGNSEVNYLYSAGSGIANCRDLITGYTFITNKGTNNCYINVTKELEAKIKYFGDIYYTGNPYLVTTDITGEGKLIKIN